MKINACICLRALWHAAFIGVIGAASLPPAMATEPPDMTNAKPSDQNDPFPITVTVEPSLVVVYEGAGGKAGRKVTVNGRTLAMGPGGIEPVKIRFDSEDPPLHSETDAAVEKDGSYSNTEFAAIEPGEYTITATAPDGRGTASATLTVVSAEGLGEKAAHTLMQAMKNVDTAMDAVERKLQDQPDSPARRETGKRIASYRAASKAFVEADPVASIHGFFGAIYTRDALLEKAGPGLQKIAGDSERLEQASKKIARMTQQLDGMDLACAQLAFVGEVAKTGAFILGLGAKILSEGGELAKQAWSWNRDQAADIASNAAKKAGGDAAGLATGYFVSNFEKLAKLQENLKGTLANLVVYATDKLFAAYCQQFAGPVDGVFHAEFTRNVNGKPTVWWKQDYKLTGRAILQYPNNAKGKHLLLSGRIEGYAHSFKTWETGLKAFDDKGIMSGTIVAKVHYPPRDLVGAYGARLMSQGIAGVTSPQPWGSGVGLTIPNSFLMGVRGELTDDKLSLLIGERIKDFIARDDVVAVIVSPLNTLGPTVTWYPLPFVDAHSVIAGAAADKPIDLKLTTTGKTMTATGTVDNSVNTKSAHGEYHLTFRLCNPGC